MTDSNPFVEKNKALWDVWTDIHEKSDFYDVEGFLAGRSRLKPIERKELPDVSGKSLLHLQCHFGLDTLSWAREGAIVTGVDFSEHAIALATKLAVRAQLDARFICCDINSLPEVLSDQFDIVFTSYGVLNWIPDIDRWAQVAADRVLPGGTFYIAEFHPFASMFDNEGDVNEWRMTEPYFHNSIPKEYKNADSYADPSIDINLSEFEWSHPIGTIVSALISAGLVIEFVHEFPHTTYAQFPFLKKHGEWEYRAPEHMAQIPMLYSIRARKPV